MVEFIYIYVLIDTQITRMERRKSSAIISKINKMVVNILKRVNVMYPQLYSILTLTS